MLVFFLQQVSNARDISPSRESIWLDQSLVTVQAMIWQSFLLASYMKLFLIWFGLMAINKLYFGESKDTWTK